MEQRSRVAADRDRKLGFARDLAEVVAARDELRHVDPNSPLVQLVDAKLRRVVKPERSTQPAPSQPA
jgi:hypothetical protein